MTKLLPKARRGLTGALGVGLITTAITLGGVALASPASAAENPTVATLIPHGKNPSITKPAAWIKCEVKTHGKTRSVKRLGIFPGNGLDVVIWECVPSS